jgi:hypothetical protein
MIEITKTAESKTEPKEKADVPDQKMKVEHEIDRDYGIRYLFCVGKLAEIRVYPPVN